MNRHTPPGRTSISWTVVVKPFGPHHLTMCVLSVHARYTSSRGASNTRDNTSSRSAVALLVEVTGGPAYAGTRPVDRTPRTRPAPCRSGPCHREIGRAHV